MFEGQPIRDDARRIFQKVQGGGVAIFPVSVGYAIVGHEEEAVRRMYRAKQRPFSKPCGNFCDWQLFTEAIKVPDKTADVVSAIIHDNNLPFSIVAPFDETHPVIRSLPPFAFRNATLAGTMDMLLNAGPLHDEIARMARENRYAVIGSSANVSGQGSKFVFEDIEEPVANAADITVDYGLTPFHNEKGLGSSIVDLISWKTIRVGAVYDQICDILLDRFDIDLETVMTAKEA